MLTVTLWRILQSQIDFEKLEEVLWYRKSSFRKFSSDKNSKFPLSLLKVSVQGLPPEA